jgi:PHD/YefM family antitoxin component YafN of YafNO toxin-antitoxin module
MRRAGVKGRFGMHKSTVPATSVGVSLPELLRLSSRGEPTFITDDRGRARAVVMDVDRYHAMMDAIESREAAGSPARDAEVAGALVEAILHRARREARGEPRT